MIKNLGLPYMGSKRKIAPIIVDEILKNHPMCEYFYDLFGGGGAISFYALQKKQLKEVVYNEFNTGVVELLRDIVNNGVTEKYYNWIDRQTFEENKNNNDWFGGLCKVVWSFGNDQRSYLYGNEVEQPKRLAHEFIVNKCIDSKKKLEEYLKIEIPNSILKQDSANKRRLMFRVFLSRSCKRFDLQQLQNLERLQNLDRLQNLERLSILNASYDEVVIDTPIEKTVIYLDPPYKNTAKYQKDIDHDKLFEWVKNSKYPVYVSSYEINSLECIKEIEHTSTFSSIASNRVIEKLFLNEAGLRLKSTIKESLFDFI